MRITADVALRLGLLDKDSAQAIQSSQRRGSPVLGSAVAALNGWIQVPQKQNRFPK